jgi:hypothetical protein
MTGSWRGNVATKATELTELNEKEAQIAGLKVYEKLSPEQKLELVKLLKSRLNQTGSATDGGCWSSRLEARTSEIIDRRVEKGQPADAAVVVEEVLPFALTDVDESVRRELFLKVRSMLMPTNQR